MLNSTCLMHLFRHTVLAWWKEATRGQPNHEQRCILTYQPSRVPASQNLDKRHISTIVHTPLYLGDELLHFLNHTHSFIQHPKKPPHCCESCGATGLHFLCSTPRIPRLLGVLNIPDLPSFRESDRDDDPICPYASNRRRLNVVSSKGHHVIH